MTDNSKALIPLDLKKAGAIYSRLDSPYEDERLSAFKKMYALLRKAGITFADFRQLGQQRGDNDDARKLRALMFQKEVDRLVKLAHQRAEFFCNDAVHATVMVHGHRTNYPVGSTDFEQWLRYEHFREYEIAAGTGAIKSAALQIAADAKFGNGTPQHRLELRTAAVDGRIYIDLSDEQFQCIEVDENGWRIIDAPPVRFRRSPGMRALPVPQTGGSIDLLRPFTNLADNDFILFVAVLLDAFRQGKHPILNLVGEHATAKSTLTKMFKKLIDPDETELRSLPGTKRDMFIAVDNARVRAWDNVSRIERTISDALCQLSDGSGFGIRKLYTDSDEYTIQGSRSIILTGLTNCVTRPDLNSRTVMLRLHPIKDEARRSEVELWKSFAEAYPLILGALLDALAYGLKALPNVRLDSKARMADFELFGHACEGFYTTPGSFAAAFAANATELNEMLLEEDPVATAIMTFMAKRTVWSGTAVTLKLELEAHDHTEAQVTKQADWPKDATRFSKRLRAVTAPLRKADIDVTFGNLPDRNKTRIITLQNIGRSDATDAADAKTSKSRPKSSKGKGTPSKAKPKANKKALVGSSRVDLQACKLEYSIVSPK